MTKLNALTTENATKKKKQSQPSYGRLERAFYITDTDSLFLEYGYYRTPQ